MQIRNDEPTTQDRLSRQKYARAFARMAGHCETPLVVGLYGTWGSGKTSLMRQIEAAVDRKHCNTVWFDAWQHQFDDSPAVALVHQMASTLGVQSETRKMLSVIAIALASWGTKAATGLSATDIQSLGERWEAEHFQVMEARTRLREHFAEVVKAGRKNSEMRVVFFIDDLDRCLPAMALKLLEALKLFLNLPGCIYFIGVDRRALEQSVRFHYKDTDVREESYLDKLVQLPFHIPPVYPDSMEAFVRGALPKELHKCTRLLAAGLGDNPREIKRFINALIFNHELVAEANIESYEPRVLAAIQLVQQRDSRLFNRIASNPGAVTTLARSLTDPAAVINAEDAVPPRLRLAIEILGAVQLELLTQYIYLTKLVSLGGAQDGPPRTIELHAAIASHRLWLDTRGLEGHQADFSDAPLRNTKLTDVNLSQAVFANADLRGAVLHAVNLQGANLAGARFDLSTFESADMTGADATAASFAAITAPSTKFHGSRVRKANFTGAMLARAAFSESYCEEANFSDAALDASNFDNARVQGAVFAGASFRSASLCGVDFRRCDLSSVSLSRAVLSRSILSGCNLSGLDLTDAIVEDADLRRADLSGANLSGAILTGSDLTGADLSGTVLLNVDLTEVEGLEATQLADAVVDFERSAKRPRSR